MENIITPKSNFMNNSINLAPVHDISRSRLTSFEISKFVRWPSLKVLFSTLAIAFFIASIFYSPFLYLGFGVVVGIVGETAIKWYREIGDMNFKAIDDQVNLSGIISDLEN